MTNEERDRYENSIVGAGMLWAALGTARGTSVEIVADEDDNATNRLLVKFDIGGPAQERGYIVTVTVPDE